MIWKCKFCSNELKLKSKYTKSGHLATCKGFKEFKENTLTIEFFNKEYILEEKSAIEIAQNVGLESATAIISRLKLLGFDVRSSVEAKTARVKSKVETTTLERYGVAHNFSKGHPSRDAFEKELFEKYGITNVLQRPDLVELVKRNSLEARFENGTATRPEDLTDWECYKRIVISTTEKVYNKFKSSVNPTNKIRGHNQYHLDHRVSKLFGFQNNIPVWIICHPANLQIKTSFNNLSKHSSSDITIETLFKRIETYENS